MKNQKENMGIIVSIIIVALVIGGVIYLLLNKNTIKDEVIPQTNTMEKISKPGDVLVMNYTGRFTDGKVFDSNILPEFRHVQPFEFKLGAGMVIKGWDEGLVGMKIGEKKTLTIPPEKAYGPNDYNGIPGNSTLIFEVELVDIK
ncbi:MAG: FKBP-type peptidyl-prolyl cis-trans isomerase [Candidatus Paceibacterota bacterium]|jgi:FKBP-type peptidyl-prolyl cis-trans isomerase